MRARFLLACLATGLVAGSVPAGAAPRPQVTGVFRAADCAGSTCDLDDDPKLKQGARVAGTLQIHVSATNDVRPLEWVRLEARTGSSPRWICLERFGVGDQQSFSGSFDWTTYEWPDPPTNSNCGEEAVHFHGMLASNDVYMLRAVARERHVANEPGEHEGLSDEFRLVINNPPVAPTWVADPSASTGGSPTVTLRFRPNPEPDLREYQVVRTGPQRQREVLAFSATNPRAQGCSRVGDTAITCVDDDFPRAFGGTYTYELRAVRAAVGTSQRCELSGKPCIASTAVSRTVTISGPRAGGGTVTAPPPTPPPPPAAPPTDPGFGEIPVRPIETPQDDGQTPLAAPQGDFAPIPGRSAWGVAAFVFAVGWLAWRLRRAILARR